VLALLASQKTNIKGGDLKRPERDVVFVAIPNMMHVLAPGGLVGGTAKVDGAISRSNNLQKTYFCAWMSKKKILIRVSKFFVPKLWRLGFLFDIISENHFSGKAWL
jgi:hypothetical protein